MAESKSAALPLGYTPTGSGIAPREGRGAVKARDHKGARGARQWPRNGGNVALQHPIDERQTNMILETAILNVRPGQEAAFEAAMLKAKPLIAASAGFVSLAVRRCIETPS